MNLELDIGIGTHQFKLEKDIIIREHQYDKIKDVIINEYLKYSNVYLEQRILLDFIFTIVVLSSLNKLRLFLAKTKSGRSDKGSFKNEVYNLKYFIQIFKLVCTKFYPI